MSAMGALWQHDHRHRGISSVLDYRDSSHDTGLKENGLGVFSPRNISIADLIELAIMQG